MVKALVFLILESIKSNAFDRIKKALESSPPKLLHTKITHKGHTACDLCNPCSHAI